MVVSEVSNKVGIHLVDPIGKREEQAPYSSEEWFENNVEVSDLDRFIQELASGLLTFIVDGSYFLVKSYLISEAWKVKSKILSVKAAFVSSVIESY